MPGLAIRNWDERGETRHDVLLRARVTWSEGLASILTVVNLSPGGLMARAGERVMPGDRFAIDLPVVGRVQVEVRWALGGRIGCQFDAAIALDRYYPLLAAAQAR